MKVIVLAGGKGARTTILPKPLMPIDDMPILEVLLRQMKRSGIENITLIVGHHSELIKAFFQGGDHWGVNIEYRYEDIPLGTAGSLALVNGLDDTFLVSSGNVLTTLDYKKLFSFHQKEGGIATIAVHQHQVSIDLEVVQSNADHTITGYIQKPTYDYPVSMGIYAFEPRVLEYIPVGHYLDFPDLVLKLIAAGEKVVQYTFDGYWMDLGRPDDYLKANEDFYKMKPEFLPED